MRSRTDEASRVPDEPGLGIEIDESKFEAYPYRPGKIQPDIYPTTGTGTL